MSKIAYADPPYIGMANKYPEKTEVDHQQLILELEQNYDAWALSCYSNSLHKLIPMCSDDIRIAAWVKPFASFKPGVNPAYTWEPVLFRSVARARVDDTIRDWVSANITMGKHMFGAKPPKFCFWLFELLGAKPDDDFTDIYPGTGVVGKCWDAWISEKNNQQTELNFDTRFAQ